MFLHVFRRRLVHCFLPAMECCRLYFVFRCIVRVLLALCVVHLPQVFGLPVRPTPTSERAFVDVEGEESCDSDDSGPIFVPDTQTKDNRLRITSEGGRRDIS